MPEGDPEHLEVTGTLELPYDKVRVALYYYADESSVRNPTLDYANLENEVGSGYDFGYYDSEREFHALGGTDETEITMVIDRNTSTGGGAVGCYHIRLPGTYSTYDEALSVASEYSDGFPAYYNGRFYALYGEFETAGEAQLALDAAGGYGEVYTASDRCVVVTARPRTRPYCSSSTAAASTAWRWSRAARAATRSTWFTRLHLPRRL